MAKRKSPKTSVSEQAKVVSSSFVNIEPPAHVKMTPDDMPFFESVIAEFARSDWTQHALEIASILSRTMCDLEREQWLLREEGSICKTDKGTPVPNPRKTIVQMHASSILSLRKSLGVDARSKAPSKDIAKQKKIGREFQIDSKEADDGLIARPKYNA